MSDVISTQRDHRLTAINTFGRGFLAVMPGDAAGLRASTRIWRDDGVVVSNSGISKLDEDGNVRVSAGGQFGDADFFLDITGYTADRRSGRCDEM